MSGDRMKLPGKPGDQKQLLITGKLAEGDSLVESAKIIRQHTAAPIIIILSIREGEMKFGSAASKKIPHRLVTELLKRITQTVHGYLAEPAKPEDENDKSD